ncbi:conserved Plasmodium protein, unknown function [Plasmodium yoelii]|uniref:Uncharacterized protein n=1 Tax=Plasmodium yoelii TaxID=5861 RepID=A0A078KEQ2_PLAYE|nr:conserved Plasmodium protein, unknown function [Plasmodium yoelii]CDU20416.1 conserved Plasmodium protein, unknown function [Plasmodium yoelii]VTZ81376.1 conserved Plasmodium protein, unknown function [Plasmodium yoelii]|eukprot:XP_022812815.1 conserved Plasmodium protein, unknown function [Plasmodium yoelii]
MKVSSAHSLLTKDENIQLVKHPINIKKKKKNNKILFYLKYESKINSLLQNGTEIKRITNSKIGEDIKVYNNNDHVNDEKKTHPYHGSSLYLNSSEKYDKNINAQNLNNMSIKPEILSYNYIIQSPPGKKKQPRADKSIILNKIIKNNKYEINKFNNSYLSSINYNNNSFVKNKKQYIHSSETISPNINGIKSNSKNNYIDMQTNIIENELKQKYYCSDKDAMHASIPKEEPNLIKNCCDIKNNRNYIEEYDSSSKNLLQIYKHRYLQNISKNSIIKSSYKYSEQSRIDKYDHNLSNINKEYYTNDIVKNNLNPKYNLDANIISIRDSIKYSNILHSQQNNTSEHIKNIHTTSQENKPYILSFQNINQNDNIKNISNVNIIRKNANSFINNYNINTKNAKLVQKEFEKNDKYPQINTFSLYPNFNRKIKHNAKKKTKRKKKKKKLCNQPIEKSNSVEISDSYFKTDMHKKEHEDVINTLKKIHQEKQNDIKNILVEELKNDIYTTIFERKQDLEKSENTNNKKSNLKNISHFNIDTKPIEDQNYNNTLNSDNLELSHLDSDLSEIIYLEKEEANIKYNNRSNIDKNNSKFNNLTDSLNAIPKINTNPNILQNAIIKEKEIQEDILKKIKKNEDISKNGNFPNLTTKNEKNNSSYEKYHNKKEEKQIILNNNKKYIVKNKSKIIIKKLDKLNSKEYISIKIENNKSCRKNHTEKRNIPLNKNEKNLMPNRIVNFYSNENISKSYSSYSTLIKQKKFETVKCNSNSEPYSTALNNYVKNEIKHTEIKLFFPVFFFVHKNEIHVNERISIYTNIADNINQTIFNILKYQKISLLFHIFLYTLNMFSFYKLLKNKTLFEDNNNNAKTMIYVIYLIIVELYIFILNNFYYFFIKRHIREIIFSLDKANLVYALDKVFPQYTSIFKQIFLSANKNTYNLVFQEIQKYENSQEQISIIQYIKSIQNSNYKAKNKQKVDSKNNKEYNQNDSYIFNINELYNNSNNANPPLHYICNVSNVMNKKEVDEGDITNMLTQNKNNDKISNNTLFFNKPFPYIKKETMDIHNVHSNRKDISTNAYIYSSSNANKNYNFSQFNDTTRHELMKQKNNIEQIYFNTKLEKKNSTEENIKDLIFLILKKQKKQKLNTFLFLKLRTYYNFLIIIIMSLLIYSIYFFQNGDLFNFPMQPNTPCFILISFIVLFQLILCIILEIKTIFIQKINKFLNSRIKNLDYEMNTYFSCLH